MVPDKLRRCGEGGLSVLVAAADADRVPACCRGVAVRSSDDFESVTVYVPVATSQEIVANVATTRRVAIVCSHPVDHATVQIKGVTRAVRLAPAADEAYVADYFGRFAEILESIGLPRRITRGINIWPAFAIELTVEEVFDQTPGPKAGGPLA
ncbi:MAG TPA: hypothetical protein VF824_07730 [Thermoanaerobaculia bacterium]|jgi:hypothetical protein